MGKITKGSTKAMNTRLSRGLLLKGVVPAVLSLLFSAPFPAFSWPASCQDDLDLDRFPPPAIVEDLAGFDLSAARNDTMWVVVEMVPDWGWSCLEIAEWQTQPSARSSLFTMAGTAYRVDPDLGSPDTEIWEYSYLKSELDKKLNYWPLFALGGHAFISIGENPQQVDIIESVVPIPSAWLQFAASALDRFETRRRNELHIYDMKNADHENPLIAMESYRNIVRFERGRSQTKLDQASRRSLAKFDYFFKKLSVRRGEALKQSHGLRRSVFTFLNLQFGTEKYNEVYADLADLIRRAGDSSELTGIAAGTVAFLESGKTGFPRDVALRLLRQLQERARQVPGDVESTRYLVSILAGHSGGSDG